MWFWLDCWQRTTCLILLQLPSIKKQAQLPWFWLFHSAVSFSELLLLSRSYWCNTTERQQQNNKRFSPQQPTWMSHDEAFHWSQTELQQHRENVLITWNGSEDLDTSSWAGLKIKYLNTFLHTIFIVMCIVCVCVCIKSLPLWPLYDPQKPFQPKSQQTAVQPKLTNPSGHPTIHYIKKEENQTEELSRD